MKNSDRIKLFLSSALVLLAMQAFAGPDHAEFVKGPFKEARMSPRFALSVTKSRQLMS